MIYITIHKEKDRSSLVTRQLFRHVNISIYSNLCNLIDLQNNDLDYAGIARKIYDNVKTNSL